VGQIEHPARGFYSPAPANPVFSPSGKDAKSEQESKRLLQLWLDKITDEQERARFKKGLKYDDPSVSSLEKVMRYMRGDFFEQETPPELNQRATTTPTPQLNQSATTTPTPQLNQSAATTPIPKLNQRATTTPTPQLNQSAAITPPPQATSSLNLTISMTPEEVAEGARRLASLDGPEYDRLWRSIPLNGPFPHPAEKIRRDEGHWQL
jgi:hypothetical protein